MGKRNEAVSQVDQEEATRKELALLEERFAAEMSALETFEPIVVHLDGGRHLSAILKSIESRFLGRHLMGFLNISWSLSYEEVTIASTLKVSNRASILNFLKDHQGGLIEWIKTPNKESSLLAFIQLKVENEDLKDRVKELEDRVERYRNEEPRVTLPFMW